MPKTPPMPRDGTVVRLRLKDRTIVAGSFLEHVGHWMCLTPAGPTMLPENSPEIAAWAPMGYGAWSPYWDDLTDELDAPVDEVRKETWWLWQKRDHPPRFAWESEEAANTEAQRLARRYPGNSFIVMHSVRQFRVELPPEPAAPAAAEVV
jgi:hypothetical protein